MDTEFKFNLQQWNTLKASGLAAYIQHPEQDRVGWILAQGVWLPNWRPKKWAIQVQKLVITFESFETVERLEKEQADFESWDYFMLTDYESFVTDDQSTVEQYFSAYTDKPEFARHPDSVSCPHEFNNQELTNDLPAYWHLKRRSVVHTLIQLQAAKRRITWQDGNEFSTGYVTEIHLTSFEMMTDDGKKLLYLGPSESLRITTVEPDGYVASHWWHSCRREGYLLDQLPIWSESAGTWIYLQPEQL